MDDYTWIYGTTDTSSKRIPRFRVEPVPKTIKSFSGNILSCAVVEPWIEFVNNTFITNDLKGEIIVAKRFTEKTRTKTATTEMQSKMVILKAGAHFSA